MNALVFFKLIAILVLVGSLLCSSTGSPNNEKRSRSRTDRTRAERTARTDRSRTDGTTAYKSQSMQKI